MPKDVTIERLARRRDNENSGYGVTGETDIIVPQDVTHDVQHHPLFANISTSSKETQTDQMSFESAPKLGYILYFALTTVVVIAGLTSVGIFSQG